MFALALLVIRNYYYFSIILVINYNKLFLYSCLLNFFHDCSFALIKHKKNHNNSHQAVLSDSPDQSLAGNTLAPKRTALPSPPLPPPNPLDLP